MSTQLLDRITHGLKEQHRNLLGWLNSAGADDQALRLGVHEVWSNVEYLKVAILDALDDAGAQYLVQVRAVDALVDSGVLAPVSDAKRGRVYCARALLDVLNEPMARVQAGGQSRVGEKGDLARS